MPAAVQPLRIARPALARRLADAHGSGSILLVAEAGFGKTAALEEALAQARLGSAWLTCAPSDRDPDRLASRLLDAIERILPGAGAGLAGRMAPTTDPVDPVAFTDRLLAELGELLAEPLVLVLDESEQLRGASGPLRLIGELVARDSQLLRLAILSREPLSVRGARLRAAGKLREFGPMDLALDAAECAAVLRARLGREPEADEVTDVMEATEGWPLGVVLATPQEGAPASLSPSSRREIARFLREEVLEAVDRPLRTALLDSSVPRELSRAVAAALGLPQRFLERVERLGLFLRPVGGRRWYRYHSLFRELLLECLEEERSGEHVQGLHARAAPALAAAGRPAEAIDHWLAAERWQEAAACIGRNRRTLSGSSPGAVRRWLERLPDPVRAEPDLRLLEARLERAAGRRHAAAALLRAALEGYGRRGAAEQQREARFQLAEVLISLGELADAAELAGSTSVPLPRTGGPFLPAGELLGAIALAALGEAGRSDELARRALSRRGAHAVAELDALRGALLDIPAGRFEEALGRLQASLRSLRRSDPLDLLTYHRAALATTLAARGEDDPALVCWSAITGDGDPGTETTGVARLNIALIHARNGRTTEAASELERAGETRPEGWGRYAGQLARALLAAHGGDAESAIARSEEALSAVEDGPVGEWLEVVLTVAPILAAAARAGRARALLDQGLALCDERFPGNAGAFYRARLLAQRSWLQHSEGDAEAPAELRRAWRAAGDAIPDVLRREWPRIRTVAWGALEQGTLRSPKAVVRALDTAFPGGEALLPLTSHPDPVVRRLAIGPAAASGHPAAAARLTELLEDPDPETAARARAVTDGLSEAPLPLFFRLLGVFEARRGVSPVDERAWGRPIVARLVRFLLVHRDSLIPEDLLFEAFWPGKPHSAARRNLQVAVSRARAVLDPPGRSTSALESVTQGYRLRLREEDVVDVDQFEAAATAALAERGAGRLGLLQRADSLWRGEPMPEERYASWSTGWRERLVSRYTEVLEALVDALRETADHLGTIDAARRLVELDRANEAAHRYLMLAYAHSGRTGHALRQYLECRKRLVEELGVEPSEATAALQRRILAGEAV